MSPRTRSGVWTAGSLLSRPSTRRAPLRTARSSSLFVALLVGAATMHLGFRFHHLQPTVALFVLGAVSGFVMEGFKLREKLGVFGASYQMWIGVDPHLLLFSLLPPLLAGDAMTIDSAVSKRTFSQAAYLARPGVLVGALLCASFLQFYFEWSFLLRLTVASILSATDPVSVVALLKELILLLLLLSLLL